mgnify:CR=1 FL=1
MIKIKQAVIVEGKYDKIKLSTVLDTVIIQTDGFGIFKDKEKQKLIKRLAQTRGIVILTDSDSAGFKIRSFIGGSVPKDSVIHAYIPDVFGKERRKDAPSKEGKLGVEGIDTEILLEALNRAGVTCESTQEKSRAVTVAGLSGKADSAALRKKFLRSLSLPERLSTSALVDMINIFMTYDEFQESIRKFSLSGDDNQ